jgi:IQ and AAA domain-containing protein
VKIGPSEVVQKFDEFYDDFNQIWSNRDESENP